MAISARYWRIRATADNNNATYPNYFILFEVEAFQSADATGTDLTTGSTADATDTRGINVPANAIDGATASVWQSNFSPATYQSWWVDFGSDKEINSFRFFIRPDYFPRQFAIDYSADGSTWEQLISLACDLTGLSDQWVEYLDIQAANTIASPIIDGMGHNPLINSRLLIR